MKPLLLAMFFCIVGSGQTPTSSACLLSPEVKPDDPFQFTMAVLESLSYAKSAFRSTTIPVNSNAFMQISDLISRTKGADLDYGCAAELLRGYQKSKEPVVSLYAMHDVRVYESVIDLDKETVALLKTIIGDGAGISPGDLAEKMADIRLRRSEQWDTISLMILGITGALTSNVPDSKGKMSSLRITTQQRKTITQKLERDFGSAVKGPEQDDQDAILRTAVVFYHWISDQGWKTSGGK